MSFERKMPGPGSRPGHEQVESKQVDWFRSCPEEQAANMAGLDTLPHISTMVAPVCEGQVEKDFQYPQDRNTQWWRRPRVFDLATESLSPYTISETIAHYRIVDPDWTIEPVIETWQRIGQLTDVTQLSAQYKLDLCEQELQFSALVFGREEAKQNDWSEAERQFLKKHLENCRELYSMMLVEYKKVRESSAKIEASDITEFWQYLGKSGIDTSFEVMNAFRLDLGRFTFWRQVISRSTVPSDVVMEINSKFEYITQIGKCCQHGEEPVCRAIPISPRRSRSQPNLTILRHWSYRKELRQRLSPLIARAKEKPRH
jgi:hypothetical protein